MSLDPRIKLVVTGDDFGYCPHRDKGIVDCFHAKVVTNVSLIINGSSAASAASLARRYNIPIGLHANLSEGFPVCAELKQNSSLINCQGFFHGKMGIRKMLSQGLLNMSEVRKELCAQIKLFLELTGMNPQHMDSHQHVHVLPGIREVFAQVLEEHRIHYTRIPVELGLYRCTWIPDTLMEFYKGIEKDALNTVEIFRKHGIRWPDLYIGLSTMGKNMSAYNIQEAIRYGVCSWQSTISTLPDINNSVSIELMTHPGYPSSPEEGGCGEGPDDFSQSLDRLHELEVLKSAPLRNFFLANGVQLCAFTDL
ncbi:carbohydrate deacetylase [Xenopus laevis]|uniref:Carbohydrate deacetylase n=2 Tax=Xenopus laevis TaxID=8355 RepID=YDJC_XENLA|nr:carbohydrate deacetylase [Xenopus laevis]Q569M2.1 RecName: Full=Carbohydrate deacetylase [Xenopus laevis]AAH92390.1 MGC85042 protein [Xenopus laevis]OCU01904.1 hypothetical protein XELAEV_18007683mg [Xenopus laevis]